MLFILAQIDGFLSVLFILKPSGSASYSLFVLYCIHKKVLIKSYFLEKKIKHLLYNLLTHFCIASHNRDIGKQCRLRSDAAESGVRSGSTLFALKPGISIKHGNNKKKTNQTPLKLDWLQSSMTKYASYNSV